MRFNSVTVKVDKVVMQARRELRLTVREQCARAVLGAGRVAREHLACNKADVEVNTI